MGHLLECVELYGKLINKSKTKHMVRRTIAAASLKMLWNNLYSIKCYDKLRKHECIYIKYMEKFWWGLIYFDQFTCMQRLTRIKASTCL